MHAPKVQTPVPKSRNSALGCVCVWRGGGEKACARGGGGGEGMGPWENKKKKKQKQKTMGQISMILGHFLAAFATAFAVVRPIKPDCYHCLRIHIFV